MVAIHPKHTGQSPYFTLPLKKKEFSEYVSVTNRNLLSYNGKRWFSLLPAIKRMLKLWHSLKCFFF
ncbi:hypothetical protein X975_11792, partial [Stegodyphus mimosarum]